MSAQVRYFAAFSTVSVALHLVKILINTKKFFVTRKNPGGQKKPLQSAGAFPDFHVVFE
jgi:hypothetical protein